MGEEGAAALQLGRQRLARAGIDVRIGKLAAERAPHRLDDGWRRGLVHARCRASPSPIRRLIFSASARAMISFCLPPAVHRDRIEERLATASAKPSLAVPPPAPRRAGDPASDLRQPFGTVIDRIHRGDHRQQHLRGADVGSRLLAADMLLAGLQRQPVGGLPARRSTGRRCGRASSASVCRAPPYRPRAVHHSPSARQSAAPSRLRYRRRVRRARPQRQRQRIGSDDGKRALGVQRRDRGPQSRTAPDVPGYCSSAAEHVARRDR